MDNSILILGGSGFIGSNLTLFLKALNYNVVVVDINSESNIDVRNYKMLYNIIHNSNIKTVIWCIDTYPSDIFYYEINITGLTNIINIMNILSIKNFIYLSSNHVYGNNEYNSEDSICFPITSEGKMKLLSEDMILNQYIFNYYILRIGNIIGKENNNYNRDTIFNQVDLYNSNIIKEITLNNIIQDYLHFLDLNEVIYKCIYKLDVFNKTIQKHIFNVGTENHLCDMRLLNKMGNIDCIVINQPIYKCTVNCLNVKKHLLWNPQFKIQNYI
jgi:nucleoside-diphosphate-sugar epimerase